MAQPYATKAPLSQLIKQLENDQADDATVTDAPTTVAEATAATTAPLPLEMIHHSEAIWDGLTPHASASNFLRHSDEVYFLGGKVYRALIDGHPQDVMVCEHKHCALCLLGDKKKILVYQSKTDGLPFVHAGHLQILERGDGFTFVPREMPYPEEYPCHKRLWKTKVKFWDGVAREVMCCEFARCEECAGKEAVEKKAARYLPGGDLFEKERVGPASSM